MNTMRFFAKCISLFALLFLSSKLSHGGGFEVEPLRTSFMYEKGGYATFGYTNRNYNVTDNYTAPNSSALKDLSYINFSGKLDVFKNFSLGLTYYTQGAIQLDYSNAGGSLSAYLPVVDMNIKSLTFLGKYAFNKNFSVIAGVKSTIVKDSEADIFRSPSLNWPSSKITGKSELGYVFSATFEKPEIALKAEILVETKTKFSLNTVNTGVTPTTGQTTGSIPNYTTINFQTGIFKDTLAFASVRSAEWKQNQITVYPMTSATSGFEDSWTYTVGIGHQALKQLSIYGAYSWEASRDHVSTSSLSITDGYQSVAIGGKYKFGKLSLSGGFSRAYLGDVTLTLTGGTVTGNFTDNTVDTFYTSLSYNH